MTFLSPKAPSAAPPPPPPPSRSDPAVAEAAERERRQRQLAAGRGSTIVTGGQGVTAPVSSTKKALFGE